jgi:hypothetical protein
MLKRKKIRKRRVCSKSYSQNCVLRLEFDRIKLYEKRKSMVVFNDEFNSYFNKDLE